MPSAIEFVLFYVVVQALERDRDSFVRDSLVMGVYALPRVLCWGVFATVDVLSLPAQLAALAVPSFLLLSTWVARRYFGFTWTRSIFYGDVATLVITLGA